MNKFFHFLYIEIKSLLIDITLLINIFTQFIKCIVLIKCWNTKCSIDS